MAARNLRRDPRARCLCGLRTTLHFTAGNRKLTCQEARDAHRRASLRPADLREQLLASIERSSQLLASIERSVAPFADMKESQKRDARLLAWRRS